MYSYIVYLIGSPLGYYVCSYVDHIILYVFRIIIFSTLICLIMLTNQCVCEHSGVIVVNSNNGNDSAKCCVHGECTCSSLSTALLSIVNNTIINITSESVMLNNAITMGLGNLTNIIITGSNVTIMCNNSGSVHCESCDDVMIKGITWDRCGDPNGTNIAGVFFDGASNISLVNCTFQYSQITAVALLEVSDNVLIQNCNFLSNVPLYIADNYYGTVSITRSSPQITNSSNITIVIFQGYFYDNGCHENISTNRLPSTLNIDIDDISVVNCNIILKETTFTSNKNAVSLSVSVSKSVIVQLIKILVNRNSGFNSHNAAGVEFSSHSESSDVDFSIVSSNFNSNYGGDLYCSSIGNSLAVTINDLNFTNSKPTVDSAIMVIYCSVKTSSEITFYKVQFNNNLIRAPEVGLIDGEAGAVNIATMGGDIEINMNMVNFISNQYLAHGALCILLQGNGDNTCDISIKDSLFMSNKSPGNGVVLHIGTVFFDDVSVQIEGTNFDQNKCGSSVVYVTQEGFAQENNIQLLVNSSTFTNNVASSMYLSACDLKLSGILLFKNNTAENGGAMYLAQGTRITIDDEVIFQFISNAATLNGGAIYVDFVCNDLKNDINTFGYDTPLYYSAMFIKNSAEIAGNSIYFSVPTFCLVDTNISHFESILYVPCQFNYSQPVDGKMMHIPCDIDYTLLNGTGAPIVTSPHELRLYFPFNDGYNISSTSEHNVYFVRNNILGHPVKFTGAVFDFFGKPTEPTQFNIQLQCLDATECSAYSLVGGNQKHILTQSVDNFTIINVKFKGKAVDSEHTNLTLMLTSLSYLLRSINTNLVIELVPCIDHPGYTYSKESQMCVCYHRNVKCSTDGSEIKRGYWFGSIDSKATTSLCPNHYCNFTDRKQTSEGYFELPKMINAQCNDHRVGRVCGKCKSGYTLSYDSTDCISVDQCSAGWTVLVITLTCLYWITVVTGVFSLMYFKFQIFSGYLYGLIYYYSMVGILLNNNPYVSDDAFEFASVLSSFAQLTPQFLGKLCFVKGLSGIDQLFIHYSHAVGVSLLLLLIVVAARCSSRISRFVSRCVIRVICLLILLSYTSIASTSLQLLLPLKFTDIKEWYAYSSPHIRYFHKRHFVYGIVALLCEIVVGIGLPLLLLLEPVLNKKINFIRIKPLLDQFQGCYKDKYRWFAAYYLICRQVIFLIMYLFNSNYYNMLFYLQTACLVIAMIHLCIRPYQNEFLNTIDGVLLLLIVLEVNINTFQFLKNVTIEITLIIVILPLILFSVFAIKQLFQFCLKKWKYNLIINDDHFYDDDDDDDNYDGDHNGEGVVNGSIRYKLLH